MPFGIIGRTGPSRHVGYSGVCVSVRRKGYFLGANLRRVIVTNQWVLTFAATRPSSQITLDRHVRFKIRDTSFNQYDLRYCRLYDLMPYDMKLAATLQAIESNSNVIVTL